METKLLPFKPIFSLKLSKKGIEYADLLVSMFTRNGKKAAVDLLLEDENKRNHKKPRLLLLGVDKSQAEGKAEFLEWEAYNYRLKITEPFILSRRHDFISNANNSKDKVFSESEYIFLSECVLRDARVNKEDDDWMESIPGDVRPNEVLINACIRLELCEEEGLCVLRHSPDRKKELELTRRTLFHHPILPKDDTLRDYFGEEIAFYFEWMRHFTTMLTIPAVMFLLLFTCTQVLYADDNQSRTVDRNPYVPLYSLIVVIWGFIFCKTWRRRSQSLSHRWKTSNLNERVFLNPNFHGILRSSPITGDKEMYYPAWKRRCYFMLSTIVTTIMLGVAFAFMIASLNLQGLIHAKTRFDDENPFHIPFLCQFSGRGGIFDPNGVGYLTYLPPIIHSIVIFILNQMIYRRIAEYLTKLENHRSVLDHDRSLILKRYFFDAFDSYIALFYLGFYEMDVVKLRQSLLGLYVTDNIRRILLEGVIPFVISQTRYGAEAYMKKSSAHQSVRIYPEVFAESYEGFDDYLEMVIEHGYITLFASACPMASFLSVFTNIVEIKADLVKLLGVIQRPLPRRRRDIGIWEQIIMAQTWLAVLTNVLIFGLSSEQMMQWCPWFFKRVMVWDEENHGLRLEQELKKGSGRYVLSLIFLIEHILIIVGLLIQWAINDKSARLRMEVAKNEYRRKLLTKGKSDLSSLTDTFIDYEDVDEDDVDVDKQSNEEQLIEIQKKKKK